MGFLKRILLSVNYLKSATQTQLPLTGRA